MATVGKMSLTEKDWLKRLGPKHELSPIVELMDQVNEVTEDFLFREANNITTHRTTIRSGLPEVYWRVFNRGVPRSKSQTIQVDDRIGMLEARSVIDAELAKLNDMDPEFMLSEESAFLESMKQEVVRTFFYNDLQMNPNAFLGIGPRYSTLDPDVAESAENVIDFGGTGANLTSIWFIGWGDLSTHLIFPKGLPMGLEVGELKKEDVPDPDGNYFEAYKRRYAQKLGLVTRDWRYNARIANVDMDSLDDLLENGASPAAAQKLVRVMIKMCNKIPNMSRVRGALYMNSTCKTMLDLMAAEKSNVNLTVQTFEGHGPITTFKGIPIRQVDLLGQEERVA